MISNKEICKYQTILYNPKISEEQLVYVERKLNEVLRKDENFKVHILLGKLYLIKNNSSLAKFHFLKAKQLKEQAQSVYHGLFKVNVIEKDYESAKTNLEKFILLDQSGKLNLELYRLLLDRFLGKETGYKIDDVYFYEKLNGQNLLLYLTAVKHILDNQYEEAIELFEKLDLIIKEERLFIDFQYVIKLVNELKIVNMTNALFDEKIIMLKDYIWNEDVEKVKETLNEIFELKLNTRQTKYILHMIPTLLNEDQYDNANSINEYVKKKDSNNEYSRRTAFYKRLIDELYEIYTLDVERKNNFQTLLRKGLDSLNEGNYEQALDYFKTGAYKTNIGIFNYYMGKVWYMLGRYREAKRNLDLYHQTGAYKIYNCKHYLSIITLKFGKKGKSAQLAEDAEYYASLLNKTYKSKLDQFNIKDDKKLDRLFELIDISEEDFDTDKILKKI